MPFPWKKNKVTRISQIVADLQSPKRGGSLVVETGFPTSLIDLFVKNRSRFTKSKSKKPIQPEISDPPPPPLLFPVPPPEPETPSSSDFSVLRAEAPSSTPPLVTANVGGDDDGVASSSFQVNRFVEYGSGSGSKSVLAAFLRTFFVVVVLMTSVMKPTVGITLSAFALLFLEYAGKRFVSCLRPCSVAKVRIIIEPWTKTVSNYVWLQKLRLKTKDSEIAGVVDQKSNTMFVSELVVGAECRSNSLSLDEIEVVETKSEVGACCGETRFVVGGGPELDCVNGNVVDLCEISQCESSKGSRSVRFKSKLVKKLVPKKLRTSMKEKLEKKSKESEAETPISSDGKEDMSPRFEIFEEQGDVGKDEEEKENGNGSSLLSKIKLVCIRGDKFDHGISTCYQDQSSLARVDEVDHGIQHRIGNSGYVILFMILAGLVVGRFPAVILTMTWCFMLKISCKERKFTESGSTKSSIPKSS